jgi:hypothetical protein
MKQLPSHVGLFHKLKQRKERMDLLIKKSSGKKKKKKKKK